MTEDLRTDALIFADAVEGLAKDVETLNTISPEQFEAMFTIREVLAAGAATLLALRQDFDDKLAHAIGPGYIDVNGKRFHRQAHYTTRNGDNAGLLRAVLDSRLFNEATGELVEESPVDKVKAVWNLPVYNARKTALKARGLDLSEFAEREFVRWNIAEDR